jgi:hypothetical protein
VWFWQLKQFKSGWWPFVKAEQTLRVDVKDVAVTTNWIIQKAASLGHELARVAGAVFWAIYNNSKEL